MYAFPIRFSSQSRQWKKARALPPKRAHVAVSVVNYDVSGVYRGRRVQNISKAAIDAIFGRYHTKIPFCSRVGTVAARLKIRKVTRQGVT
jgi:hypothetical protein